MAEDKRRLIEVAFPLKQTSLDSVHEKNVRHGHISTLHIWPARRPLAACRAALIATLLPDPGNDTERKRLLEKLGGVVKTKNTFKNVGGRKIPVLQEYTEGGILHWGRESSPDLDFFREEIKKAYGGRAPRVLDPFAGGGAIPLEAMRLGCATTSADINPVAWFILKCTLEYPQQLAGQKRPLPRFALESPEFMDQYWNMTGNGKKGKKNGEDARQANMLETPDADFAWHVRAWGYWVLGHARKNLAQFYPAVDGKPTVAYLWARTVTCKNCRATIPLLKTLWLSKKDKKRIRLKMTPKSDRSGVDFDVVDEPLVGGNAAQQRAHDQGIGRGTMSKSGVWCPVCGGQGTVAMTMEDIKSAGMEVGLGSQITSVVIDGDHGKVYRGATTQDSQASSSAIEAARVVFDMIPFGSPSEAIPGKDRHRAAGSQLPDYGFKYWTDMFTPRQRLSLGTFLSHIHGARQAIVAERYPLEWMGALYAYLAIALDRLVDRSSTLCTWDIGYSKINHTFSRYAFPMTWDFCEGNPISNTTGNFGSAVEWVAEYLEHALKSFAAAPAPTILLESAPQLNTHDRLFDLVFTDPPYYDAIPYADLMDFFYVWLRRSVGGLFPDSFSTPLVDKRTELVQLHRTGPMSAEGKAFYESGMSRAFEKACAALDEDGRMVIVFANKQTDAWETLAASLIKAGLIVNGSWPIVTEMITGLRNVGRAALASSVWLVCRKRPETAKPGWDNQVLEEMRTRIYERLRTFWDAGIRGPDFVWAATGPALEAYSKHPVVKKADDPDSLMTVSEFLQHVRRIVVDYVVGRVLSRNGDSQAAEGLDNLTVYYLLHRNDFGLEEATVGACILYAQSCNLADRDLVDRYDILAHGKGKVIQETEDTNEEEDEEAKEGNTTSGSTVRLKRWDQRTHKDLGLNTGGRTAPVIDQVHRIMRLWKTGDVQQVDSYLENQGLRQNPLFPRLIQALIELAGKGGQADEHALLESIMNHITARGAHPQMRLLDAEEAKDG
jgi:putative DNA methylase